MIKTISNRFKYETGVGGINFLTNVHKAVLLTPLFVFDKALHGTYAGISAFEIANGNGYTTGGIALTVSSAWAQNDVNGKASILWDDLTITAIGDTMASFGTMVIINDSHVDKVVVLSVELEKSVTLSIGKGYQFQTLKHDTIDLVIHQQEEEPTEEELGLLDLINQERINASLEPLTINTALQLAAEGHAEWMAVNKILSHTGEGGSTLLDRVIAQGYLYESLAENVAMVIFEEGVYGLEDLVAGWMDSTGHRSNILSGWMEETGVALAMDNEGRTFACQVFGVQNN